jgi:two-component system, NarL family, sensor histidine kinase LiaS
MMGAGRGGRHRAAGGIPPSPGRGTRRRPYDVAVIAPVGLRSRAALSYVAVSAAVVLGAGCLLWLPPPSAAGGQATAQRQVELTAAAYASQASAQAAGGALSPERPFTIGSPGIAPTDALIPTPDGHAAVVPFVPADDLPVGVTPAVALVTDLDGTVVASSFPSRFPPGTRASSLPLAARAALSGSAGETDGGHLLWSAEPVVSDARTVGTAYVQSPPPSGPGLAVPFRLAGLALLAVVLLAPVGAVFGLLTMRGSVRRLRRVLEALSELGRGDHARRLAVVRADEIGAVERQFNATAVRLAEATALRLSAAAAGARQAERERLAGELHDAISQDLFAMRATLHGLEASHAGDADLVARLGGLRASSSRVIGQLRALVLALRPAPVGHLGLSAGLRELAERYAERLGLAVETAIEQVRLEPGREEELLQVAQEALSNAARHSGARRVELGLRTVAGAVELRVADDGRGFDVTACRGGLGLVLAREAAERAGGRLQLSSGPRRGTSILVRVPARR